MFTYSIMRLDTDHFNEIIEDIKDQYKRGISTCPLFIMELVPEGTPVWDKVTPMCEKFRMFKKELDKEGITVGIKKVPGNSGDFRVISFPGLQLASEENSQRERIPIQHGHQRSG